MLNRDETDDDEDLLTDSQEKGIGTDPCAADTDGDGVADGYEYQSARDLNDDEHQTPNDYLPYPGKRPYPNALFADAGVDYDGDSLTLGEEFRLWKFYTITGTDQRSLTPLSYSDGEQYTARSRSRDGHREPTLADAGYDKRTQFLAWAGEAGYRNVELQDGRWRPVVRPIRDSARHATACSTTDRAAATPRPSCYYNDIDRDGWLSDDERDEDADGLTNYDESHGRMVDPRTGPRCYDKEKPYPRQVRRHGRSPTRTRTATACATAPTTRTTTTSPTSTSCSRIAASHIFDGDAACDATRRPPELDDSRAPRRIRPGQPVQPVPAGQVLADLPPRTTTRSTGAPFDGSPNWYVPAVVSTQEDPPPALARSTSGPWSLRRAASGPIGRHGPVPPSPRPLGAARARGSRVARLAGPGRLRALRL